MGQRKQTEGLMPPLQGLPGLLLTGPGVLSASFLLQEHVADSHSAPRSPDLPGFILQY